MIKLFPEQRELLWINELLDKCVVERENQMKIPDGAELLMALDQTIAAAEADSSAEPRAQDTTALQSLRNWGIRPG